MSNYTAITIIYNPNSTGPGKDMTDELASKLRSRLPKQKITVLGTEYVKHAEELGYSLSTQSSRPLIISASGDGGYHELVNGIMKAQNEGAKPVSGLLPAGNANDHFHAMHDDDIVKLIEKGEERRIDLLKLTTATASGDKVVRYAHSYIGAGLTPKVGKELNKTTLNWFNQLWIVARVLFFFRPTRLIVDGKVRAYDSIILSNIEKMSKVFSLSKDSQPNDNRFEITIFRRRNKMKLIASLLRASTVGLSGAAKIREFSFSTIRPTLVQLDGEVLQIEKEQKVIVTVEHKALRCIV